MQKLKFLSPKLDQPNKKYILFFGNLVSYFTALLLHQEWNEEIMTVERASYADIYTNVHTCTHYTYTFAFIFSLSSACSRSVGHSRQPSAREQTHIFHTLPSIAHNKVRGTKRPQAIRKWIYFQSSRTHRSSSAAASTHQSSLTQKGWDCNLPTIFCGGGNLDFFVAAAKARLGCVCDELFIYECAKIYTRRTQQATHSLLMLSVCVSLLCECWHKGWEI